MNNYIQKISQIFTGIMIVAVLTLIADAFTEPTQTPPSGNVSSPLNVSGDTQTKPGNLTFRAMYDANDGNYYVDPAANSVFYRIYASYLESVSTINGGSPITSSNIGGQSVSYASSAGSVSYEGAYYCFCAESDGKWSYSLPWNSSGGTCRTFCGGGSACTQHGRYWPSNGSYTIESRWNC